MFGPKEKTEEELRTARHADPKADCPLWQAPCKQHGCRFYIKVEGTNPNTGMQESRWDCAVSWLPFLLIENSQQQRQTGASTDKVANEIDKFHRGMVAQNNSLRKLMGGPVAISPVPPNLIEGNNDDDNG